MGLFRYVDWEDFRNIYSSGDNDNALSGLGAAAGNRNDEAIQRELFDQYDLDRDGFISAADLQKAFAYQGRHVPYPDIMRWVRLRDSTHSGRVSFEDFSRNYSV